MTVRVFVPPLALSGVACAALFGTLSLAARGALDNTAASLLVPAAFIATAIGLWKAMRAARAIEAPQPRLRSRGSWLLLALSVLTLPQLGSFGLIDPWETHYAEVAREMIARSDPISMWWGHQGWFMSKPPLTSWLEALSMLALGVETAPGEVLGGPLALARPEWAVRLPGALFALAGCFVLYRGVAAHAGSLAGFLASLALASSAHWTLASRHALTDTPFAGALTAALGFSLLAWSAPDASTFAGPRLHFGRRSVSLHPRWGLVAAVCCVVGAQLAWLLWSGLDLDWSGRVPRLRALADTLASGSPGNSGLPGQRASVSLPLAHPELTPALQALLWSTLLVPLVWSIARERRTRSLLLLASWLCMSLATLAKGAAGFVLPLAIAATTLALRGRRSAPWRGEVVRGTVLLSVVVGPWLLAAFARHGRVIFDQLVLQHMVGRALEHLHDTNASEDVGARYYLWQLGYAAFPWTGFIPAALSSALVRRPGRAPGVRAVLDLSLVWLVLAFALFTFMRTKFHHYILPALPALAVLIGVHLAEAWAQRRAGGHDRAVQGVLALGGALLTARVGADLLLPIAGSLPGAARLFHLVSYRYDRPWPGELDFRLPLLLFTCTLATAQLGVATRRWARHCITAHTAIALAFAAWLGQRYLVALGPPFGQREVIAAFYRDRTSAAEPLIAYQLNWKGENFYTGNRLAIFVSSGKRLRRYIEQRRRSEPVLHVVLERQRLPALRATLGDVKSLDVLSEALDSDKICVVRVRL